jgi:hypothetical protein
MPTPMAIGMPRIMATSASTMEPNAAPQIALSR